MFVTEHKQDILIMQDILCEPTVTVEYCEPEKSVKILRSSGIWHIFRSMIFHSMCFELACKMPQLLLAWSSENPFGGERG
jgi:hypothetical protein